MDAKEAKRKHGSCCTCQSCGKHYDDCQCDERKQELEQKLIELRDKTHETKYVDELPPFKEWYANTKAYGGTRQEYNKLKEALPNGDGSGVQEGHDAKLFGMNVRVDDSVDGVEFHSPTCQHGKPLEPNPKPIEKNWYEQVYSHDNPDTPPYGWIQWKGTDVCIDLHCLCGVHGHFDGDFMYAVKCLECGRKYAVGQNVKLIELDTPELQAASKLHHYNYVEFSDD